VDRPGHGLSDFQPERRLVDWPGDVVALADHLGIDSFAVSGWSFGGPYAMTCARLIPERLTSVALISSFAPHDRPGSTADMARSVKVALGLARRAPWWLARGFMSIQGRALTSKPEETAKRMLSSLPEVDREVLEQPAVIDVLVPAMTEAYRNGADGAAWEGRMLVRPWGFDLAEIGIPIEIWHGDADVNNPLQSATYLRDTLPESHTTVLEGEGHFHIFRHWGDILAQLTG
jgi:pimeloyl-ACP methyl ester carboxylesterase